MLHCSAAPLCCGTQPAWRPFHQPDLLRRHYAHLSKRVTRGAAKYRPFDFAPVPIRWHSPIPPAILGGSGKTGGRADR